LAYLALDQASKASVTLDIMPIAKQKKEAFDLDIQHQSAISSSANMVATAKTEQLDYAYDKIYDVIKTNPAMLFDPQLNLVLLDVYLARNEYIIAANLAQALLNLDLNERFIPEIMLRQIKAYCGLKDIEAARETYKKLSDAYPFSPTVTSARQTIIVTFDK